MDYFLGDSSAIPGDNNKAGDGGAMRGTTLTEGSQDFSIWAFGSQIWSAVKALMLVVGLGKTGRLTCGHS